MPIPSLTAATMGRISTAKAPKPSPHPDPNVGKEATMNTGYYAGLKGIIYPPDEGVRYMGQFGQDFIGNKKINKPYLLLFFYDDGTFFCGVETDLTDCTVHGGVAPPPQGSGTVADPFQCGVLVSSGVGTATNYHELPSDQKGIVRIDYDFYGLPDSMNVYFINDLTHPIAQVPPKTGPGYVSFYYDPAFNPNKIVVEISKGISGTAWQYKVNCPS
jgi:hypothetical protein